MKLPPLLLMTAVLLINFARDANGLEVLTVFPMSSRSHYIVGHALARGLAEAGHEVTMISPFQQSKPIPNYKEIVLEGMLENLFKGKNNFASMTSMPYWKMMLMMFGLGEKLSNLTLTNPNFQAFITAQPKQHFDVVIVQIFGTEPLYGLGQFFNAPVIGVSTFGAHKWNTDLVGTPIIASYVPHTFYGFSDRMTFWERLSNSAATWLDEIVPPLLYTPKMRALYDRHFGGPGKPTYDEVQRNVSLVLLNSHVSLGSPRPLAPNMIEVGGMHINRDSKQVLPADLQKFMDEAKSGVIYFSMGSNMKSTMFVDGVLAELFHVFAEFKDVRVIFKGEAENAAALQSISNNTLIQAWYPQEAILAHPNLKLFITHGGLLSTTESVYHGVPVIGIPILGDQKMNMKNAESVGYGVAIQYASLDGDLMREALKKVLYDPKYAQVAKLVSSRFRDQMKTPMETAVYWVEYVVRHKGCPHLRSSSIDFPFYKLHNLDVSLVLLSIVIVPFVLLWLLCRTLCRKVCSNKSKTSNVKAQKKQKTK